MKAACGSGCDARRLWPVYPRLRRTMRVSTPAGKPSRVQLESDEPQPPKKRHRCQPIPALKVLLGETVGEHRWRKYAEAVVSVQGQTGLRWRAFGNGQRGWGVSIGRCPRGSHWEVATMKNMTCRQLGGACDQKLSAQTWDEMVKVMTKHVMEKHPDV